MVKQRLLILSRLLLSIALLWLPESYSQETSQPDEILQFKSAFETFEVTRRGRQYYHNDKPVELGTFKNFLPLFDQKFTEACTSDTGKKLSADLRVVRTQNDPAMIDDAKTTQRLFYIGENKVGDGTHCLKVSGSAMYYLPLHSSWYENNNTATVKFGGEWTLKRGDQVLGQFKSIRGEWMYADTVQFVDWDFVNRFVKSLESFSVDTRIHPAFMKQSPELELITPTSTYELYRIGENSWILKSPRMGWLIASSKWGFWQNMNDQLWFDRFKPRLQALLDKTKPVEERQKILLGLGDFWNKNIQLSFQQLLSDSSEPTSLRLTTLALMKKKPSLENFQVFIDVLNASQETELQSELTKALRVRNPKGPVIVETDDEDSKRTKTQQWMQWWQTQTAQKQTAQ